MKPSSSRTNIIVLLMIAIPLLALAALWNSIPAIVPLHYNFKLHPDRLADKSQLWLPVCILAAAALLAYTVLKNAHKIDPRRYEGTSPARLKRLAIIMAAFISALNLLLVISSALH